MRRLDPRQRAGLTIVTTAYLLGYLIGRAGGRVDTLRTLLEAHAAGSRRT